MKCNGTRAETRFRLSAKRASPFKSAWGVSSVDYLAAEVWASAVVMLDTGSEKGTGYPLHSPVSPSLPLPCVTVCHHISAGVYQTGGYFVIHSITKWCNIVCPTVKPYVAKDKLMFVHYCTRKLYKAHAVTLLCVREYHTRKISISLNPLYNMCL